MPPPITTTSATGGSDGRGRPSDIGAGRGANGFVALGNDFIQYERVGFGTGVGAPRDMTVRSAQLLKLKNVASVEKSARRSRCKYYEIMPATSYAAESVCWQVAHGHDDVLTRFSP